MKLEDKNMLELLLKKNECKQVLIMEALLKDQEITKINLELNHKITLSTLNRYIRNINAALSNFDTSKSITIETTSEKIFLSSAPSTFTHTLFHDILISYLHESTVYQTLKALLLKNEQNTAALIHSLNISSSYFNKVIKQINNYLSITNVQIRQKNNVIFFKGNELNILYLEFLIRQYLSKIDNLPYHCTHSFPELDVLIPNYKTLNLTDSHLARVEELHRVLKKCCTTLNTIEITDSESRDSLSIITSESDFLMPSTETITISSDVRLLINLLIRLNSTQFETKNTKNKIGLRLSESQTELAKDAKLLVDNLISTFFSPMSVSNYDYYEFIYNAHLHLIYIRLFGFDIKSLFKLTDEHALYNNKNIQPGYLALKNYFEKPNNFSKLAIRNQIDILNNKNLFIDSSYSFMRRYRKTTVSISFDFIYRLSFEQFLQTRLRHIFSENILIFSFNTMESDILVTDYIPYISDSIELFTFTDTNSVTELENLLSLITRVYSKRIMEFENYYL